MCWRKGVSFAGIYTLSEYVQKMKENGFTLTTTQEGMAIFEGDFASYKKCTIGVNTLKQKDLVNKIAVISAKKVFFLPGSYR